MCTLFPHTLQGARPVKPKSSLKRFFIGSSDCGYVDGVSTPAHGPKIRYWGKVAVESGRGGEASAPAANDWRVKRLRRTDL